jgi:sugar lactone lactonase YvrE
VTALSNIIKFLFLAGTLTAFTRAQDEIESHLFTPGSKWETVCSGYNVVEGIASLPDGKVYLTDVLDDELLQHSPDGKEVMMDSKTTRANGLALEPNGKLYSVCMSESRALVWDLKNSGARTEIPLISPGNDLVIAANRWLYWTWGPKNLVLLLDLQTLESRKVAEVPNANGIALSYDGKELWVGEFVGKTVQAFPISENGDLGASRAAFQVKVPENGKGFIDGMMPLKDGRLLASTALGLQILSADGTALLLPNPTDQRANYVRLVTDAAGDRWIYAAHVKSVLRRRTSL